VIREEVSADGAIFFNQFEDATAKSSTVGASFFLVSFFARILH